ncbi:MAG: diguanylate cyclase domain-containing protein, partial [Actinomycetota bacterium]
MSLPETPVLVPLLAAADRTLADFAVPAAVLPADRTCQDLELALRAHPGWTSVVVVDGAALGLLPRARFEATMSGRFGYGRALWNRRPVAPLADWDPLVLDAGATVGEAAAAVVARPQGRRYDDLVLLRADGSPALVSTAAVLESLAGQFALRALHDGLTGAVGRDLFFARLEDACRAAARSNGHVAVVYADLDRFKLVNDGHGHNAGDALLVSVVRRLRAAARPGDVVARRG